MSHTVLIECHGDLKGLRFLNGLTLDSAVSPPDHTDGGNQVPRALRYR
ncbi:hypothetical protein ACFYQA_01065 [Streptomyces sp. NPDC005774]